MTNKQLREAQKLFYDIERCERQIETLSYYNSKGFAKRESFLKVTGMENDVIVPESLFRIIIQTILSEYNTKLIELKKEFEAI